MTQRFSTHLLRFQQTGLAKYKTAVGTYRSQLNGQPRTAQGQFWHKLVYFNQGGLLRQFINLDLQFKTCAGWLDGIYMGEVFYTAYTKAFDANNATAWGTQHLFRVFN
jgi:unsaturated rhamnogalacturonyl hydrolase